MHKHVRVGTLLVRSGSQGGFEIIHLADDGTANRVAVGKVQQTDFPALDIASHEPQECIIHPSAVHVDELMLETWRASHPADYTLRATRREDGIRILLTGHRRFQCFWWHADISMEEGKVRIDRPVLASDPDS